MRKIPTVFVRDWDGNPKHVTREVNPECAWVLAGEGVPTIKWDGTCVGYLILSEMDGDPTWVARREVKAGKELPDNFWPLATDPETGKAIGWEPIACSSFAKFHAEALREGEDVDDPIGASLSWPLGTYELIGPKINGNPQGWPHHGLIRHGHADTIRSADVKSAPRDYDGLAVWLQVRPYEGIVWHHPDGRMAKIKRRDFPAQQSGEAAL